MAEHADRRAHHLQLYLEQQLERGCKTILIAEAFGYRGGRVTGVPLTSERIVQTNTLFQNRFPALAAAYECCREPEALQTEATASIAWKVFENGMAAVPLCWNIVPVHPYHPERGIWSNRPPRPSEIAAGAPFAKRLIALFEPERIVAVGRCAERGLAGAGIDAVTVRHPSNGGARLFREQMLEILNGR